MEDQQQQEAERSEAAVRSRWSPKAEQILILESIFNSGIVNPQKDETVKIRKLLENFGTVADANVFYWFQNRRSRSRRRQRQLLQAQLGGGANDGTTSSSASAMAAYGGGSSSSSSSCGGGGQEGFSGFFSSSSSSSSASAQMGFFPQIIDHHNSSAAPSSSVLYLSSDAPNLNYTSGFGGSGDIPGGSITVFVNGVATEVQRGPIDLKTMFGEDLMLVHSSGVSVPTNDFGFSTQSLHHGESYFLVSKQTQV